MPNSAPAALPATRATGVFLDADSLGPADLDFSPLSACLGQWRHYPSTTPEQLHAHLTGAQVVITNKVVLDAEALAAQPQLRLICVAATGTNNIDLDAAAKLGITVCNAVNYGPNSVAQHALMLMLNLATQAPAYSRSAVDGSWSKSPFFCLLDYPVLELAGKTLGIVGYGVLGQRVATLGEALGMRIMVSARPGAQTIPAGRHAFDRVLAEADVLSLHCPLTADNHQLINAQRLAQMKPSAFLINCARGGLIDEPALADALRQRRLAGAGLDVLSQEPPPADHPLLAPDIPNLIITPHSAWASREARQNLVAIVAANIAAYFAGHPSNTVT